MSDTSPPRRSVADELRQMAKAHAEAIRSSAARDIQLDRGGGDREEAITRHQPRLSSRERGGR